VAFRVFCWFLRIIWPVFKTIAILVLMKSSLSVGMIAGYAIANLGIIYRKELSGYFTCVIMTRMGNFLIIIVFLPQRRGGAEIGEPVFLCPFAPLRLISSLPKIKKLTLLRMSFYDSEGLFPF